MASFEPLTRIARPSEAHGVTTPKDYRAFQAAVIAENKRRRPAMAWRDPFVHEDHDLVPFVSAGRWVVLCRDCRNAPLYDPDWKLACCPECGAIYEDIEPPAEIEAIEAVLMARPHRETRSWIGDARAAELLSMPEVETVDMLVAENVANGDAVPAIVMDAIASTGRSR